MRQYFVASETRSRMGEMVGLAERVDPIECAHALEAQVRELRLIAAHKPRYNRRSKFPERSVWLKLTVEAFPRLSIVRDVRADGAAYLGPLRSQRQAEAVRDAIHDAVPLRQCSDRLSLRRAVRAACALAGIGRCCGAVRGRHLGRASTRALADLVAAAWTGDVRPLIEPLQAKLAALSAQQRYEQAAVVRDRIATVVRACARMQRLAALRRIDGAGRGPSGRRRRLGARRSSAAAGSRPPVWRPRGVAPWPVIEALLATADVVDAATAARSLAEETECVLRWLEEPGTRLVRASEPWAMPAFGAGGLRAYLGCRRGALASTRSPTGGGCRWSPAGPRCAARAPYDGRVITAIVMISVESDKIPEVAEAIAELDGVSEVYSVAGDVDLIAIVRVREFDQIADVIAGRLSKVPGVRAHRHAHRLPRLLAPRPGGDVLHRRRVAGARAGQRAAARRPSSQPAAL